MVFHKPSLFECYSSPIIAPKDKTDSTVISFEESVETPVATGFSVFESKLDYLADLRARMSHSLSRFTQPRAATSLTAEDEGSMKDLPVNLTLLRKSLMIVPNFLTRVSLMMPRIAEKKVHEGIAKRINNVCTKKPANEKYSAIQKKYFLPENCEF